MTPPPLGSGSYVSCPLPKPSRWVRLLVRCSVYCIFGLTLRRNQELPPASQGRSCLVVTCPLLYRPRSVPKNYAPLPALPRFVQFSRLRKLRWARGALLLASGDPAKAPVLIATVNKEDQALGRGAYRIFALRLFAAISAGRSLGTLPSTSSVLICVDKDAAARAPAKGGPCAHKGPRGP